MTTSRLLPLRLACLLLLAGAMATTPAPAQDPPAPPIELDEHRQPALRTNGTCFLRGGTLLTGTGAALPDTHLLIRDGKIAALGPGLSPPPGATVIDVTGKYVTPGLVDAHSHVGILGGVNEATDSITAEVRIEDVLQPDSLALYRALSGGFTTALVLHGSANAIGGQSSVVKLKWRRPADELLIPDAPRIIKFALGENITQANQGGSPARFPSSRRGAEAVYRRAFAEAREYDSAWARYQSDRQTRPLLLPPRRDLRLETLAAVLRGEIWVHCHAYRADEMLMMLGLAREYGFKLAAFQHALEAYKIAPELAAQGVGISTFADHWAYKMEAWDANLYNAALCHRAGVLTSINSDDFDAARLRRLRLDAAKSMRYGGTDPQDALRMVTLYPAQQLGVDGRLGTLEPGKDGDVAVWEGHPLSVYSRCVMTLLEGEIYFQRRDAFGADASAETRPELPRPCPADHAGLPVPPRAAAYAIVGATLHPISGPSIPEGTLLIRDGKIAALGARVVIPEGAVRVPARGLHAYPGLIDAGSQLGLREISSLRATVDDGELGEFQPDLLALSAVNPDSEHLAITRCAGVTTTLTHPVRPTVAGQSALIDLDGWTPEQMAVSSPAALHVYLPTGPSAAAQILQEPQSYQARARQHQAALRRLRDYFEEARRSLEADPPPTDPRLEALRPYLLQQRPVVFHAQSERAIRDAVRLAEELKVRPILAGGQDAWKVAALLAERRIPVLYGATYDLSGSEFDPYDASFAAPGVLHRAGVKLAFQSSGSVTGSRELPHQVGIACAHGLPREAGLRALTLDAAEILGVADRLGSLEPGKIANVVVTDGDPLEIAGHPHYLFIRGHPVALENRHTRLYRRYRARLAER